MKHGIDRFSVASMSKRANETSYSEDRVLLMSKVQHIWQAMASCDPYHLNDLRLPMQRGEIRPVGLVQRCVVNEADEV